MGARHQGRKHNGQLMSTPPALTSTGVTKIIGQKSELPSSIFAPESQLIAHQLKNSRVFLGAVLTVASALSVNVAAQSTSAGNYPVRPIRLVVPFAAGSSTDITARRLDHHMSKTLGQQLVVDNRAGAVGVIGADLVRRSTPDGYTLLMTAVSSQSIAAALRPKTLPYDVIKDFTPIARIFTTTNFVVANPGVPANNLQELIAYSKKVSGGLSYGTAGNGSSNHLAGEALRLTGANIVHVPYNNVSQAITSVLAGEIPLLIYTVSVVPYIKSGKLKALAVTSEKRHPQAPDIPTVVEQGIPGAVAQGWSGLFGPAGLPVAIRDRLYVAVRDALADPDVIKGYIAAGQEEGLMAPVEFRTFLEKDVRRWKDVVARAQIPTE
jgi:tripartite-type tricarboxylate transporter receptor subunit TctC